VTPIIFEIQLGLPGTLAITPRPGGWDWLEVDIAALYTHGVNILVSLLERDEASEVYVRPFPPPASGQGGKLTISTGSGSSPRWSRAGNELMYRAGDQIMAVSWAAKGETFVPQKPRVWIPKLNGAGVLSLAPDGKRIAVLVYEPAPVAPPPERTLVYLQNFFDELRRRVPLPN